MIGSRWPGQRNRQDGAAPQLGSDPEGPAERLDPIADVLEASTRWDVGRVKPLPVVCDLHGQRLAVVVQPERELCGSTGVFCGVLDRLRAGEVECLFAFYAAARRGSDEARLGSRPGGQRAQRFCDAEVGEQRGVDPASDVAHRVERRLCAGLQLGELVRERGRGVWILSCERELDDQRYELVLDPVVQITLECP